MYICKISISMTFKNIFTRILIFASQYIFNVSKGNNYTLYLTNAASVKCHLVIVKLSIHHHSEVFIFLRIVEPIPIY